MLLVAPAWALSLTLKDESTVADGITLREYRASSPDSDVWVALIDLCTDGIYLDATRVPDSTQSTGSWAEDEGVALATNGDFYKTDPVRVYGDAVGNGLRWPSEQTGLDADYADEWYYEHSGWIAFGHDWVELDHTGWVKDNVTGLTSGWSTAQRPDPPPGTIALVSGFPELIIEGERVDCSSATADDCFPDRSDMRERHPRTAMGLTEDRGTFILAVVDGRTSDNDGMYGEELAELMATLGAWEAFNLDGGGSSQLWADGYINDYDGNNYGDGARSVVNHWGVFAGGANLPDRAGHCATAPPCGAIAATGGTVDDTDACFRAFGPSEWWRTESQGEGGSLHWTNTWASETSLNWAWWQFTVEQAGTYRVEASVDETYGVWSKVHYDVLAGGALTTLSIDQGAASGWVSLGDYTFAAGGDQYVAVYDDATGDPGDDQHITADAIRLTRLDLPADTGDTADTADTGTPDSGDPADTATDSAAALPGAQVKTADVDCGCASARGGWWPAVALAALTTQRRRRPPA